MENITKETDKALCKSEERYRLLEGETRIIGWEYDPYEDRFTFVSEKAQEITGYTIEQWSEKGFWASHIHPEDKDFAVRYCKNATKKGKDHEFKYRMITADGGFIWLRDIVQVVLNNGKVTNLRGVLVDITHHKKVEEDLELFKVLIDQTNDAVFVVDSETGSIIDINEGACRSLGYEREEILNMKIESIVTSPKEFFRTEFEELKTKGYMRVEGEHKRKDNTTFPVEVNAKAVVFRDKRYMIAVARDTTERKKIEKVLKESEYRYRSLFCNMLNGFAYCKIIVDENNKPIDFMYLEVNDAFERLTGLKKNDIIGEKVTKAIPAIKDKNPELFDIYGKVALTGEDTQFEIYFEPLEIWFSISVYSPKKGYFVAIFDNITERKQIEEALRQERDITKKYLDVVHVIIVVVAPDHRVRLINKRGCEVLGYSEHEIIGENWFNNFLPEEHREKVEKAFNMLLAGKIEPVEYFENPILNKAGQERIISWHNTILRNRAGDIVCTIGSGEDITERRKVEEKLQEQKEALEKKNIALNEVLGQIEIEKKQIKDNIIANAETLLLPIIEKISLLKGESSKYAQLLQKNLQELTSSFGAGLSEKRLKLTSREIDVCNMVKNGLTSKEIASLLNISLQTIEKHRSHIRKKLGIANRKLNLSSVLKTI